MTTTAQQLYELEQTRQRVVELELQLEQEKVARDVCQARATYAESRLAAIIRDSGTS